MKTWASAYYRIPTVQGIVGVNLQNSHLTKERSHNLMCKVKNQLCQDVRMNQEPSGLSHSALPTGKSFYFISCCQFSFPSPSLVFFNVSLTVCCPDLPHWKALKASVLARAPPGGAERMPGWESGTGIPQTLLMDTVQKIKKTEEKLLEDHFSINLGL